MNRQILLLLIVGLTVLAVAGLAVSLQQERQEKSDATTAESEPPNEPVTTQPRVASPIASLSQPDRLVSTRPQQVPGDGYLGSDACKKCHEEYYQSWHASYHRTMTQIVSPASAPPVIEDSKVNVEGLSYVFTRREDDYFVQLSDPIVGGARKERQLVMMTGSHHMHVFWYASGIAGTPAQLPIIYLLDQQRWIPRRSAFLRPTENRPRGNELGRWNSTCSRCHSTHPQQRPDVAARTWDTQVSDFGIACEACHGPGQGHVVFHEGKGGTDVVDSIVHPLKLPVDSRSDLCGQCHAISNYDFNLLGIGDYLAHGSPFRPGQALDDDHFHRIVRAGPEHRQSDTWKSWNTSPEVLPAHFWPDGEVRISGRDYNGMIESACFKKGDLSCMSCHTMHQQQPDLQDAWKNDQLKPDMRGDAACVQCHPTYKELGSKHTHHPIESSGSRCMNCHMPHTVYGLLKTIRSHTITSPSVATTIETGRPNACSLCHLDHTLEQTSRHLAEWYGHSEPQLTGQQRTTAASVLQLLAGDAAQRALQVAAMERPFAREASGSDWMRPYLLIAMDDPYEAIRLIAERVYRSLPGTDSLDYDFLDLPFERKAVLDEESERIQSDYSWKPNPALLIDDQGRMDQAGVKELIDDRDQRPVHLLE